VRVPNMGGAFKTGATSLYRAQRTGPYIWPPPSALGLCSELFYCDRCSQLSWSPLKAETIQVQCPMLFQHLAVALATGLAIGTSARDVAVSKKRDVPVSHILHERQMEHWDRTWEKRDRVPESALLPMRIGLRQSNIEQGRSMLAER
jgi:hypothetical protein